MDNLNNSNPFGYTLYADKINVFHADYSVSNVYLIDFQIVEFY